MRQVQVVILDEAVVASEVTAADVRRVSTIRPGRFPLSRGRNEAVDDAVVVEAALWIFRTCVVAAFYFLRYSESESESAIRE